MTFASGRSWFPALLALFLLVGCGAATTPQGAGPVSGSGAQRQAGAGAVPDSAAIARAQQRMLGLINEDRRAGGVSSLAWDEVASAAARRHAQDMAGAGYFSHTDRRGTGPMERYRDAGGRSNGVGENIFSMSGNAISTDADLADAVRVGQESFMNSEGHRNNIMNGNYKTAGVGLYYDPVKRVLMIVQVFTWG